MTSYKTKNATYTMDFHEDDDEGYYSELAGDFAVNDKKTRNKRNNTTCYSSKHTRQSMALKAKVGKVSIGK